MLLLVSKPKLFVEWGGNCDILPFLKEGASTKLGVIGFPSHRGRWEPAFWLQLPRERRSPITVAFRSPVWCTGTGSMLPASGTATVPLSAIEAFHVQARIHSRLPSPLSASGLCGAYRRPVIDRGIFPIYKFTAFIPTVEPWGILPQSF